MLVTNALSGNTVFAYILGPGVKHLWFHHVAPHPGVMFDPCHVDSLYNVDV